MGEEKFQVGDLVVLKSGGPLMAVCEEPSISWVECSWFDLEKRINKYTFRIETLKRPIGSMSEVKL